MNKGIEKGSNEGEYRRSRNAATKLLSYGLAVDKIADATSLTIEEVERLKVLPKVGSSAIK